MPKTAESTFNTELGNVLRQKHPRWPDRIGVEQTGVILEAAGLKPDLVIRHPGGLPVAVETEYTPASTVEQDAIERLGKTLKITGDPIEQALAVRIPNSLARVNQNDLGEEIERSGLEFCILAGKPEDPDRWPKSGWLSGSVDDLAAYIELAALSENRVARGMYILELGIDQAAVRLRDACADAPDTLEAIAHKLHQKDGKQTSRMAMAIVANALTFHTAVAGAHGIRTLDQLRAASSDGKLSKTKVLDVWRHILTNVNYWPIFKIASDILLPIRNGTARELLEGLFVVATDLVSLGATSQHDLCGRMFQRLISDRKFLATFYTLPSSAALLAELAVPRVTIDWSDGDAVTDLRIGDFACGTGALLKAAYETVLTQVRRHGLDDKVIHPKMMAQALVGSDIMPAATHLTASVLSSTHPSVTFGNTSIFTLPYGQQPDHPGRQVAIGALDLIEDELTFPLFGTGRERLRGTGDSDDGHVSLPHGKFDLVIMNPPFTRSTGHEAEKLGIPAPAFAGFSTTNLEMRLMASRLREIRKPSMVGAGNAGLASHFIDLAHAKVNASGVLALVLPASLLQGKAWAAARTLFDEHYDDVVVVSIAASGATSRAFSADTGMAEVLIIANRKSSKNQPRKSVLFVNLNRRPQTILEAVSVARTIQQVPDDRSVFQLPLGSHERAGCAIRSKLSDTGCAGVRDADLVRTASALEGGQLHLPRLSGSMRLPVVNLGDLGDRGLYHMDISGTETNKAGYPRGPFDIARVSPSGPVPTWPALWSHNAPRERQMMVARDSAGEVRPGRNEHALEVWHKTASRLHFNRDFRLNSQSLAACLTPDLLIGGRAWPSFLCTDRRWETPIVCWANTTLGLISFWWISTRQHQGRVSLTISKLPTLNVLDPRQLTTKQVTMADEIFDEFQDRKMLPANEAWRDSVRQKLDEAVLIELLQLPQSVLEPLRLLRLQWCAEPSVHGGKRGTAPPGSTQLD